MNLMVHVMERLYNNKYDTCNLYLSAFIIIVNFKCGILFLKSIYAFGEFFKVVLKWGTINPQSTSILKN